MSDYLAARILPKPNFGDQQMNHYVQIFTDSDVATLVLEIDTFFADLRDPVLPHPAIQSVEYSTAVKSNVIQHSALVHYVTVG